MLAIDNERVQLMRGLQRLLAFLALRRRPVNRGYVAGLMWPETTTVRANANLRTALWRAQLSCADLIDVSARQVSLTPRVAVDLCRAEKNAHRLIRESAPCDDILTTGTLADLSADLLPDWHDEPWLTAERERYHYLRLHALEAMSGRLAAAGRHGEAVDAGLAAVRAEPFRESAHRCLIKAHLAAGNRAEALRQFETYRVLLRDELALAPSTQVRALLRLR